MSGDVRPGGRERILTAALEVLERDGEAALRFADIAERADVAISVITHHFATREGLVTALHAQRFAGLTARDLVELEQLAEAATSRAQVIRGMAAVTAAIVEAGRADVRLARVVSIGATHGRPELAAIIRRTATELLDTLTRIVATAQARGFLDRTVDARVFATFFQAYALGMIVADLDETPVSRDEMAGFIGRVLLPFQTGPEDTARVGVER